MRHRRELELEEQYVRGYQENHWQRAARMGFQLRREGITVPFTDLLIAAVALESGAVLLHRDRHFDYIASQSTLKVESVLSAYADQVVRQKRFNLQADR